MIKMFAHKILLLCLLLSYGSQAQRRTETLRKADYLYNNHKIYEAIDLYTKAHEENPTLEEVVGRLAYLCLSNNATSQALQWYEKLLQFEPSSYPKARYQYALLLQKSGNYEKAIQQFNLFIESYSGADKNEINKKVKNIIKGCNDALVAPEDTSYQVYPLSKINSTYTDLSPFKYQDKIYFSSIQTDSALTYSEEKGIEQHMDLWEVDFNSSDDTTASAPKAFGPKRTLEDQSHYAGITLTKDGTRMYLTKCNTNKAFKNHCAIYASKKEGKLWSTPVKLGASVNDPNNLASSTHPCVVPARKKNKEILYFSSNKNGGRGGYDLWEVEIEFNKNFKCGKAKNLGNKINSAGDDITPSVHEKGQTLYFASKGHGGFGGFDVFIAQKKGRRFKKPTQLPKPFNTSQDEFFLHKYDKDKFLLVSNRTGAKTYHQNYVLDDIFVIRKESQKFLVVNTFLKDSAHTALDSIDIQLTINGKETKTVTTGQPFEVVPGSEYMVSTQLSGYINTSKSIQIETSSEELSTLILEVEKVEEQKEIRLNNIYFDFNSAELKDSSKIEVDSLYILLTDNPKFKIEIGAHTDNKGKKKYNEALSQRRAQSVVNYLTQKGITPQRLVAKGYGMSKPIAPNTNKDGSDNPEGRQLNRRIVFKIIGMIVDSSASDSLSQDDTLLLNIDPTVSNKTGTSTKSNNLAPNKDSLVQANNQLDSTTFERMDSSMSILTTDTTINRSIKLTTDSLPKKSDTVSLGSLPTAINLPIMDDTTISTKNKQEIISTDTSKAIEVFTSEPIDASVTKNKFRWLRNTTAQSITCEVPITIKSLRIIAKKKTGVTFSVRVVKARSGKTVLESKVFSISGDKTAPQKKFEYFDADVNLVLPEGKYFIFPIVTTGQIGYLGNYTNENNFLNKTITIGKAMFSNLSSNKTKYKFKLSEAKNKRLNNYGPFFKVKISATE